MRARTGSACAHAFFNRPMLPGRFVAIPPAASAIFPAHAKNCCNSWHSYAMGSDPAPPLCGMTRSATRSVTLRGGGWQALAEWSRSSHT